MNSNNFNSWAMAVLSALLVIFASRVIIHEALTPEAPEKPGFDVAVAAEEQGTTGTDQGTVKEDPPLATLLPAANVEAGQKVAKPCLACHDFTKGGPNKVGPNLWGIVGRDAGKHEGFAYSPAMAAKGGQWSYDELYHYLKAPRDYVKGTKMAFAGVKKPEDRANLVLYLRSLADTPAPLP